MSENNSSVKSCSCKHVFQDEIFGIGKRLMNRCKPKEVSKTYRCTVCKREH